MCLCNARSGLLTSHVGVQTPEEIERRKQEAASSKKIDQEQGAAKHEDENWHKVAALFDNLLLTAVSQLLLLGAGESGKSTLFKQMITM